ncbi:guanine nucleotide-binding protein-like 3 [Denticeps clupeoides]|uniref:Guanine nucleotide-binding protein-like 3 n=1 Tax=Denticeps clupeoides TaxID=299321 RepID=A0AAY4DXH9_9TELE|nr:guanine nucleotide-binding protein-like 3 [Denticeps clupeoides]
MKRPKLKKASKRMSCAKRFKIQKKVREHNRKLRKDAKKNGVKKRVKKDLGVPNSAPFKEEVLREAEQRKIRLEELKQKNKLANQQERAKKRKQARDAASAAAEPKAKKVKKERRQKKPQAPTNKSDKRFRCAEINKVIEASDVVIEVLDARDPLGCRCPQLEEAVLKHGGKKKLMFLLTKADLVPKENLTKWLHYLEEECPTLVFKASTQLLDRTVQQKKSRAANAVVDISRAGTALGESSLLQMLADYSKTQEPDCVLKVGVVGFPNVGKSSFINTLKGIRACHVGVQRGITKTKQEVHICKNVKMIDTPGVVASPSNPAVSMVLRSLQIEEKQASPLDSATTLLKQCDKQQVMLQYNVPDYRNSLEFFTCLAKKRGFLQKGGVLNTDLAATTFLNDWTGPKLSYFCKPPDEHSLPPYHSASMVTEMQRSLDMDKLKRDNEETVKRVKCPTQAASIVFTSKGPTMGILNESEIPEQKPVEDEPKQHDEKEEEENEHADVDIGENEDPQQEVPDSAPSVHKVRFQSCNIDLPSVNQADDAYDFNTDFV